jgi:hypothetical protein
MKLFIGLIFIVLGLSLSQAVHARDFHALPYDFLFGNHIDTHQETRLKANGDLFGFFYIIYTGNVDTASGLPIARHPRGLSDDHDERCGITVDCVAGWLLQGKGGEAKFLFHSGVNGNDHPVWLLNRVDIPQPGSYTHFHWITETSTDSRASELPDAIPSACNKTNASQLETVDPSAVDVQCPGWFLQLIAVRSFAFEHGGEIVVVHPGIDNATHVNLLTNFKAVKDITATRSGDH